MGKASNVPLKWVFFLICHPKITRAVAIIITPDHLDYSLDFQNNVHEVNAPQGYKIDRAQFVKKFVGKTKLKTAFGGNFRVLCIIIRYCSLKFPNFFVLNRL